MHRGDFVDQTDGSQAFAFFYLLAPALKRLHIFHDRPDDRRNVISKYRGQSPIRAESLCKFLPFPDDLILVFVDKFGQSHNLTRHISWWPRRADLVRTSAKGATHGPQERASIAGCIARRQRRADPHAYPELCRPTRISGIM